MISHNIYRVNPVQNANASHFKPDVHIPITQTEYNTAIEHFGIDEGDFVTMSPTKITSRYNVHYVVYLEKEINRAKFFRGKPQHALFCQLESATVQPWIRFDGLQGYRLLTAEEYERLIGEEHDNLRHRCIEQSKHLIPVHRTQSS